MGRHYEPANYPSIEGWDALKECVQTGDLILYSGHSLDSLYVCTWLQDKFSHVGMVLWLGEVPYLFHSYPRTENPCVLQGKCRDGVQLNDLEATLRSVKGLVYYMPMGKLTDTQVESINGAMGRLVGAKFCHELLELLRLAHPLLRAQTTGSGKYSCSELLTHVYRIVGLLGMLETPPPNEVPPFRLIDGSLPWTTEHYRPQLKHPPLVRF